MHLIIKPCSFVLPAITVFHDSLPIFSVIFELADILIAISPPKLPFAIFLIMPVLPLKRGAIRPTLFPIATALIIFPVPLKHRFGSTDILTKPMRFIITPITYINITIWVE